jgi:DNA-binding CsgD family transcriptional regulator
MLPPGDKNQPDSNPNPKGRRPFPEILRTLSTAARHMHAERGRAREFRRALHRRQIPMVTVSTDRRVLDANLASRLLLHLSLDELRRRRIDDLIEPREALRLPELWERLLERGELLGIHELSAGTRSGTRIVVVALANVLPGEHLLVLAPAEWPGHELVDADLPAPTSRPVRVLSGREQQVLELVARGSSLREIGEQLAISEATVRTHLRNANGKLGARNRAHAVGLALTLGLIGPGNASQ